MTNESLPPLHRLLALRAKAHKSVTLGKPPAVTDHEPELLALWQADASGCTLFNHALCIYAGQSNTGSGIFDIDYWNTKAGWKRFYGDLLDDITFFAEDVFGSQFGITQGTVVRFEPETADVTLHSESLDEWAEKVMVDTAYETGSSLAAAWEAEMGPIPAGHRLLPLIPFAVGGEYTLDNLEAVAKKQAMQKYAWLAQRLLEVAEGEQVELTGW